MSTKKKLLSITLILLLAVASFIYFNPDEDSKVVVTTQYTDINGDKGDDKVTDSYQITDKSLDTVTVDTKAQDVFLSLKEKYPYLYSFDNNGQVFTPTTMYRTYKVDNDDIYLAYAEYKLPAWSGVAVVVLQESPNGYRELLKIPYSNSRGRWQSLSVENLGRTIKITGDIGKIGCHGVDCRVVWFDYYDYNPKSKSYELANHNHPSAYRELLDMYEIINKDTCVKDTGGRVNDTLLALLPKRTSSDTNFCDEQYGTELIEYKDVKNFAQAYSIIESIIAGKNESYFK